MGVRRARTAPAADGSAFRAVVAGEGGWEPVGGGSAEARDGETGAALYIATGRSGGGDE